MLMWFARRARPPGVAQLARLAGCIDPARSGSGRRHAQDQRPETDLAARGLAAGVANTTELLASGAMESLLNELAQTYSDRIIVFDAPPLLPSTESRVLATHMGQIVVVVEADRTPKASVAQAFATLEACPVVMSVLNKCSSKKVNSAYGYYAV